MSCALFIPVCPLPHMFGHVSADAQKGFAIPKAYPNPREGLAAEKIAMEALFEARFVAASGCRSGPRRRCMIFPCGSIWTRPPWPQLLGRLGCEVRRAYLAAWDERCCRGGKAKQCTMCLRHVPRILWNGLPTTC